LKGAKKGGEKAKSFWTGHWGGGGGGVVVLLREQTPLGISRFAVPKKKNTMRWQEHNGKSLLTRPPKGRAKVLVGVHEKTKSHTVQGPIAKYFFGVCESGEKKVFDCGGVE